MHISQALRRSKHGSIYFRKRLSVILVLVLLLAVIVLAVFHEFPQLPVAGNITLPSASPAPDSITTDEGTGGGSGGVMFEAPEYGFSGGIIALIVCFAAFALFTKRSKLFSEDAVLSNA